MGEGSARYICEMDVMVDYIRDDMLMIYELFGVCGVCVCLFKNTNNKGGKCACENKKPHDYDAIHKLFGTRFSKRFGEVAMKG